MTTEMYVFINFKNISILKENDKKLENNLKYKLEENWTLDGELFFIFQISNFV